MHFTDSDKEFCTLLRKMETDLESYKKNPSAKQSYIEKQDRIIKQLHRYRNDVLSMVEEHKQYEAAVEKRIDDKINIISKLICILQLARVPWQTHFKINSLQTLLFRNNIFLQSLTRGKEKN